MKNRDYYKGMFTEYPDLVTVPEFCKMLGGIDQKTARGLLHNGKVKYFDIRGKFLIPKMCIIEYVLSPHYVEYKKKLKAHIKLAVIRRTGGEP